ncbi:MAG: DUF1080 domain-containing protein [Fimbriimonadaceae bacterium]|nr:DUF1080 domain-containing protein [Fimbriimonadaceae bacterium]
MLALLLCIASDTSIFDGRTLNGWEVVGGGKWTVADGVLKGTCTKSDEQGVLIYKKPVRDFNAKLQFRISEGNSGFYFRAERIKEQPLVKGFQAEVDAIEDVGGIWETAGRGWVSKPTAEIHAATKFKPGAWTDMDVSAIGTRYVVKLNGHTTVDIDDPQGRREGCIGLQLHGGVDMTVEFRNLHLKPVESVRKGR